MELYTCWGIFRMHCFFFSAKPWCPFYKMASKWGNLVVFLFPVRSECLVLVYFGVGLNDLPQIIQSTQMCLHDMSVIYLTLIGSYQKNESTVCRWPFWIRKRVVVSTCHICLYSLLEGKLFCTNVWVVFDTGWGYIMCLYLSLNELPLRCPLYWLKGLGTTWINHVCFVVVCVRISAFEASFSMLRDVTIFMSSSNNQILL